MLADLCDRDATFVEYCASCGYKIGMCGYTAVPEDGRTCLFLFAYVLDAVSFTSVTY